MKYQTVIGLEIHAELCTESKVFCSCKNGFGFSPNTNCCPVCTGLPGALPVLNSKVYEYAIKAGLSMGSKISKYSVFERKNYFYPDLPKAYQISQLEYPLCIGGHIELELNGVTKIIRLNRIHVEEDAGKLIHSENKGSLIDFNRCSVPLIEMVTEPDLRSAQEAVALLEKIRQILVYLGISTGKMEQGAMRCDVNVSLMPEGSSVYGTRTELKNISSFRSVFAGIEYEVKRQTDILEKGGKVIQETRRWSDEKMQSFAMRNKEESQSYRYFPDPDLLPITVTPEYVQSIMAKLPRLPEQRIKQYVTEYNLPIYDATLIASERETAEYFEDCLALYNKPKEISNFIMSDILRLIKGQNQSLKNIPVNPKKLTDLLKMVSDGKVNVTVAKTVLEEIWKTDEDPEKAVVRMGLMQVNDMAEIEKIVREIIAQNPQAVEEFKAGKSKALAFFVGQIMKATKGKANPQIVNELVIKLINI
ncbi:MAG: Asp-tRNA(Asn)/Glu-tRNA(Gln) amidotransferase subunit GatB [Clostridia bacterium]|jgi:aspartyl-tRNA(Asn)/glutamyl-tRNA(Gln) amidotransferase subunit B|nr:Asp-tRNA(Asn)/Glu-tRNA(Gln) amidotransferase subunit GatB [Clostridia bacterium]MDD4275800.1 Asp-tRNA(Asn)/Glu-tRNA(Gln) amidotransferase subunit GatB [Clostridia bacterium]